MSGEQRTPAPAPGDIWRNRKNGHEYAVLHAGFDATNVRDGTPVIIYRRASIRTDPSARISVRETTEFIEKFEFIS